MDATDPTTEPLGIRVQQALAAEIRYDFRRISASVHGARATLKGAVHSWAEHEAAERATLSVPGVETVDNQLCLCVKGALAV